MKLKSYTNNDFNIIVKSANDFDWKPSIETIETPTTLLFAISTLPNILIKKIIWDFGTGKQVKSLTNRKFPLNGYGIGCKYKKSHDTTITIQASVYTDDHRFIPKSLTSTTLNHIIKTHYVDPDTFKDQILKYYKTDNFTDDVAESIYKIANRLAFSSNFINYCVDSETEALTQRGWLTYKDITTKDTILSYNINDKKLTWSSIKEVFVNENYNGPMHYLTTPGLDALVTPNHKFVSAESGLKAVEHIKCGEHIVLNGLPVESMLSIIKCDDNDVKKIALDYINESEFSKEINIFSIIVITNLNQDQRTLLIETILRNSKDLTYIHKDKLHIDNFLMLCTLAGIKTTTKFMENDSTYNVKVYMKSNLQCKSDDITFHPTQQYTGTVWCPKTEYGTFVCKRNGSIYVTGNTYREEMVGDAILLMVKALTKRKFDPDKGNPFSYFTRIAFNAFCNRIKEEKKNREELTKYQEDIYGGALGETTNHLGEDHSHESNNYEN